MQPQDNLGLSSPLTHPGLPEEPASRTELQEQTIPLQPLLTGWRKGEGGSSHAYREASSRATSQPGEHKTWPGQPFLPWECQTRAREMTAPTLWVAKLRIYILRSSWWSYCLPSGYGSKEAGRHRELRQIPGEQQPRESENSHGIQASGFSLLLWPSSSHALRVPALCDAGRQPTVATRRDLIPSKRWPITSAGWGETKPTCS